MEDVGLTQARFSMPRGILLFPFRIDKNTKGIGIIWKLNILGMNQLRSNWGGISTTMEEEEEF